VKLFRLSALALLLAASAVLAAEPAPPPREVEEPVVTLPDGTRIRTVDPGQMKFKSVGATFSLPVGDTSALKDVKPPPAEFDFGRMKDGTPIQFPMLGNDRYGDCFYVAPAHQVQTWIGMSQGKQLDFDQTALVRRYLRLSPRDSGLGDDQVIPEWKAGIIGPNGPHKILDCATIDPGDWNSVKTAAYYLGGLVTTHSLRTTWMNPRPGAVWDKTGVINRRAGHAVQETGVLVKGGKETLQVNTWGMQVYMTAAGLASSNAEVLCSVSPEWFDSRGYSPVGVHYNEVARVWLAGTGRKLPQGLFPDPVPEPPPAPPKPPEPEPAPPPHPVPPTPDPTPAPPAPAPTPPAPPAPAPDQNPWQWLAAALVALLVLWRKKAQ